MSTRTVEMELRTPTLDSRGRVRQAPLGVAPDGTVDGFGSEHMLINIGPQHPATHGVLRLVLELEGETVTECRPVVGYLHTGIEKNLEYRNWTQGTTFVTRMDYLSSMFNETAYCLGVERLLAAENGAALERLSYWKPPVPVRYVRSERARVEVTVESTQSLTALVPLILILMTITGAVYPAIDLTAGERERGTLEILVAAPVPRLGLLFAKYLTVMTVAMLTAVVNLVTMMLTLNFSGLGQSSALQGAFSAATIVQLLFLHAATIVKDGEPWVSGVGRGKPDADPRRTRRDAVVDQIGDGCFERVADVAHRFDERCRSRSKFVRPAQYRHRVPAASRQGGGQHARRSAPTGCVRE